MGSRGLLYAGERHCFPHPMDGLQHAIQKQGGGDEVRQAVRDASASALVEGLKCVQPRKESWGVPARPGLCFFPEV